MTELADRIAALTPEARQRLLDRLRDRPDAQGPAAGDVRRVPRDRAEYPLSFNQERLWFLDQLVPNNPFYNLVSSQVLPFRLDAAALRRALAGLALRHEALRTTIHSPGAEPSQRISGEIEPIVELTDLAAVSDATREAEAGRRASAFSARPFDLERGPLWRTAVIGLGRDRTLFVFVIHHIIADGWSLGLLMQDLGTLYSAALGNRPAQAVSASAGQPPQYLDYAVWQRERYAGGFLDADMAFWLRQLEGLPALDLPTDRPRPAFQRFTGDSIPLSIPAAVTAAARGLAHRHGTTLFVVLLAAFAAVLHRCTDQTDVPIGVPVANRPRTELENTVGFFANNIIMRGDLAGNPPFARLVDRLHATVLDALEHQELPFTKLVAAMRSAPDLSRNPLFQVSFQLITGKATQSAAPAASEAVPGIERATSIFDLAFNLWESGSTVEGLAEFDADLFDRPTIERLCTHFLTLLEAAVALPETAVGDLPLLTPDECDLLLNRWGRGESSAWPDVAVPELVARQAALTPAAVAIRNGADCLSFSALEDSANRLAQGLIRLGVGRGDRVGIMLPPSPLLLTAMLGTMKSGAAFVPVDTAMPAPRASGMLADCQARMVLVADGAMPDAGCPALRIEDVLAGGPDAAVPPGVAIGPEDLAYVLFTSGSTGRPKGAMIPHRAVANYLLWCLETYPVTAGSGAPMCSPVSSDMSVTTLFLPLLAGRTVEFLENGHPIEALERRLNAAEPFSFIKVTPSHLDALRLLSGGQAGAGQTAALVVGGEQLLGETLGPWRDHAPDTLVFNEYGPTETTVGCCVHAFRAGDSGPGPVPIGRPIANTQLYVLDSRGAPLPAGVPGELYIGGAGVGSGYIGRPDLTAGSFVADPFSADPASRLYRTGDRVRWNSLGILEYLGRMDSQIKIRGYRVEPGEIEATLRGHSEVADAAVISRGSGAELHLAAFIVPQNGLPPDQGIWQASLTAHLARLLPVHMQPALFIPISSLPQTPSGKVDRKALAAWEITPKDTSGASDRPPGDAVEDVISRVFADVLHLNRVGMTDDFFAVLGGHSLLAAKAVARLRELLGVTLQLGRFFESPTVERLAISLREDAAAEAELDFIAQAVIQVLGMTDVTAHPEQDAEHVREA